MVKLTKEELELREQEDKLLEQRLEEERIKLEESHEKDRKKFIRKIKPINKIYSNKEEKQDAEVLKNIRRIEQEKIDRARKIREEAIKKEINAKRISIIKKLAPYALAIILVIGGGVFFKSSMDKKANLTLYNAAIVDIHNENYKAADEKLTNLDIEDSHKLREFIDIETEINEYDGDIYDLYNDLISFQLINDPIIKEKSATKLNDIKSAIGVQDKIDEIDPNKITLDSAKNINNIKKDIEALNPIYRGLLNTSVYDSASKTIYHLKNNTDVGKVIAAINNLGKVSLKSKDKLSAIKTAYNKLSKKEKAEVINYDKYTTKNKQYKKLKEDDNKQKDNKKKSKPKILTIKNCPDLKALLYGPEDFDIFDSFAKKYAGKTITFNGSVDYVAPYSDRFKEYKTRYDVLTSSGDYSEDSQKGPTFKFEDINSSDLKLDTLYFEDEIYIGKNIQITAKVDHFDYEHGLFYLIPVSIKGR